MIIIKHYNINLYNSYKSPKATIEQSEKAVLYWLLNMIYKDVNIGFS